MIIKFTRKIRQRVLIITSLIILLGGGIYLFKPNTIKETSNIEEGNRNKYTIDVIFDDESKRLMCNQNLMYVNKTGKDIVLNSKKYIKNVKITKIIYDKYSYTWKLKYEYKGSILLLLLSNIEKL